MRNALKRSFAVLTQLQEEVMADYTQNVTELSNKINLKQVKPALRLCVCGVCSVACSVCLSFTQLCGVESGYTPAKGTPHCSVCQHV